MTTREPTELDRLCTELGITIEAKHVALRARESTGKNAEWSRDEWRVVLSYQGLSHQGKTHVTTYYCGLGHRKLQPGVRLSSGVYQGPVHPNTRDEVLAAEYGWTKPMPPTVGDVIYCLASDSDALEYSFDDWCSNLGENNDSIKARDTYLACQKTGDALMRMFGKEVLDKIRNAEH